MDFAGLHAEILASVRAHQAAENADREARERAVLAERAAANAAKEARAAKLSSPLGNWIRREDIRNAFPEEYDDDDDDDVGIVAVRKLFGANFHALTPELFARLVAKGPFEVAMVSGQEWWSALHSPLSRDDRTKYVHTVELVSCGGGTFVAKDARGDDIGLYDDDWSAHLVTGSGSDGAFIFIPPR
jgi:hypothetical protein